MIESSDLDGFGLCWEGNDMSKVKSQLEPIIGYGSKLGYHSLYLIDSTKSSIFWIVYDNPIVWILSEKYENLLAIPNLKGLTARRSGNLYGAPTPDEAVSPHGAQPSVGLREY